MDAVAEQVPISDSAALDGGFSACRSREAAAAELGQRALLTRDVDDFLGMAVGLVRETLDVEYAGVLHQPAVGEPLVLIAGSGWAKHVRTGETTVPCGHNSQAGCTLLSRETVIVEDLERETRFVASPLLVDHGVVSGMTAVIPGRDTPFGVLGVHSPRRRLFTPGDGDFLRLVANIVGIAVDNTRIVERVEQSGRYEGALAECAQALLASSGEDRIQRALEALLVATEATWVFLERNVIDAELGFCSQTIAEAAGPGARQVDWENDYWSLSSWDRMPISRASLEKGLPIVVIPESLEGIEGEQYARDPYPVKSELNVPILVDGEWAGLIGLSDQTEVRHWSDTDLSLLTTAARMFGAFWEREADRGLLAAASQAKDEFLASVSHELRTPLTAVVGFAEVLRNSEATMSAEERAQFLDIMVEQGADLTNIISDLLVAAKSDIGDLVVASVPVDLRAQTAQVLESLDRGQITRIGFVGDSVRAMGDPDRVRQVVRNLVSNALRYGGDAIRIVVLGGDATASVLVCDNGPPISEEDRELIFQPYERAHNAPGLTESIGLGLAISRQLARLMGGDLTYRHQHEEGIFELTLPRSA